MVVFRVEIEPITTTLPPVNTTANMTMANATTITPTTQSPDIFRLIVTAVLTNNLIIFEPEIVIESIEVEGEMIECNFGDI